MIAASLVQAGMIGYACAAAAYLMLAVFIVSRWTKTLPSLLATIASVATSLCAAVTAYHLYADTALGFGDQILEIARSCLWCILLLSLLYWLSPIQRSTATAAIIALGFAVAAVTLIFGNMPLESDAGVLRVTVIGGHLALALLGIALIENLFRNSPPSRYWTIKHLCLGLGALFTYDFFFYSDALLFRRMNIDLFLARGAIDFLASPLLAIAAARGRKEGPEIAVTRRAVMQSATLIGAGLYLIAMAGASYYVQRLGGTWSSFLQVVFFFAAALLFLSSIFSASLRARLRVLVEKNLFRYKYDYRAEWLRFIRTTSESDRGNDLRVRVVQAVCDIVDSPEGALWSAREQRNHVLTASWNMSRWGLIESEVVVGAHTPLVRFLERTQWIIDLDEYAAAPNHYQDLTELPAFMPSIARIWLVVPLIHHERLFGIIMIGRPRAPRTLTWEDFDLLKIVGRQVASYLAEEETSQALAEARQFEAFNKRFAFVVHDIKNLASQLSLILSNAERHSGSEAFQRDAGATLRESVDKLNRMLRQLQASPGRDRAVTTIALAPFLGDIVAKRCQLHPAVRLEVHAEVSVSADENRLTAVVDHLVQNALDAVGDDGSVRVRLSDKDRMAIIEIEDDGPGMEAAFIREKLFRPFATTKATGYGIGVYESRDYANSLGGRLDVVSQPGKGTVMRMSLPIAGAA
jgi:putative PEP-CTERM system histidine kinase